jgi:tetrathionate reductase subunit B
LLVTCRNSAPRTAAFTASRSLAVLTLPSLLILNETHLLYALRCGADGVVLIGCPLCHHGQASLLETPLRVARALAGDSARLVYIEDDGTPAPSAALRSYRADLPGSEERQATSEAPAPSPEMRRRDILATLLESPGQLVERAEIVGDVPFGRVTVEAEGCTLCGGCARLCPTSALGYEPGDGQLTFAPLACVNCGLCAQACPEKVLTLTPGLHVEPALLTRQTLVSDEVVPCRHCGTPFIPARLLRHVQGKLAQASGPLTAATQQIDCCPTCRSVEPRLPPLTPTPSDIGCRGDAGGDDGSAPHTARLPLLGRRGFLRSAITTGIASAFAAFTGDEPAQAAALPPEGRKRLAMAIDLERCIGCHACTAACKAENQVPLGVFRDWVEEHQLGQYPYARPYFLPKLCNHCDDPGCLRACPSGAIHRRPDGIVDLNHDICIGCRACNQACPYGATFMDPVRGTADKCNFCAHRVDQGLRPACVDICPTQCRIFGDVNDADSPLAQFLRDKPTQVLRPELGLGPNVQYVALPNVLNR